MKTNIFKFKPPEVHFTIRNRVPYNKLLANLAFMSRTWEYWPSVVFVETSGQYSPVRPSRSVSKRLLLTEHEGRTGEYWTEVMTVRTEHSEVCTQTAEGQYSTVRLKQAKLVSCLLYGTLFLIVNNYALLVACT